MLLSRMSLKDEIAEMYVHEPKSGPVPEYEGWVPAQPALCIPALRRAGWLAWVSSQPPT